MSAEKVIEAAEKEVGITEYPPNSNMTKFGQEYGMNGYPWCVMFIWHCFREAGESMAFFGGGKTASCGTLLSWYKQMGWTVPASEIKAGDIVILNFHGTKDTEHCGLVTKVLGTGRFQTIEGNTAPGLEGSQDNGGSVAVKTRYSYQVVGVCRPQFRFTAEQEKAMEERKDWRGHWAEDAILYVMENGLMKGYPDGTFQPDKAVTRAELAEILRRMGENK